MQEVLSHIREEEVARLACDLVDVPSPTGRERAVGEFVRDWLDAHGIEARLQDLGGERVNVIGILPGCADGVSLQLNGHLDTNYSGDEDDLVYMSPSLFAREQHTKRAYVRDGRIHGIGIGNMKAGLAAMLTTIKALRQGGVSLRGDFMIAGVSGENGGAPVDRYQGVERERAPSLRRCATRVPMVLSRGDLQGRHRLACPGPVDTVGPSWSPTRGNANLTAALRRRDSRSGARANGGIS